MQLKEMTELFHNLYFISDNASEIAISISECYLLGLSNKFSNGLGPRHLLHSDPSPSYPFGLGPTLSS